jgi:ubiquinone/menaquinone biosynthesis C-methylase UbiE
MNTRQTYNRWADQYDTNVNKTRDLEAMALKRTVANRTFNRILEIGCGTGKNTQWLQTICREIVAIDLSEEMLAKAKEKITAASVSFRQADITQDWTFAEGQFDLITFSLVLEHIENLHPIFDKAARVLNTNGRIYIGELHPFKQYAGTKARFETELGTQVVPCFNHHVSDFARAALQHSLVIEQLEEYFDDEEKAAIPRILTLLLQKS